MKSLKTILIIEDEETDRELYRLAFSKINRKFHINFLESGTEIFAFLKENKTDLILLDLNFAGMNGLEVLHSIKSHPDWKIIPTIILSASSYTKDIDECYKEHANCFIEKPETFDQLVHLFDILTELWFDFARLR